MVVIIEMYDVQMKAIEQSFLVLVLAVQNGCTIEFERKLLIYK